MGGSIGILGKETLVSGPVDKLCGYDGKVCGQGRVIYGDARTLAVKAGVSFAKPAMMIATVVTISVYAGSSLWEVYSEKTRRSQQLAQRVYTSLCMSLVIDYTLHYTFNSTVY